MGRDIKFIAISCKKSVELKKEILNIKSILENFKISLLIEPETARFFDLKPTPKIDILNRCDFIIALGGDGTLISTAREFLNLGIIGVYAGSLGFLTDIKAQNFNTFINDLINQNFKILSPHILNIKFYKNNEEKLNKFAFNDIVISRNFLTSMIRLDAFLNDKFFNTYIGDGLIISSAIGSTAYNLSAFGSVIYPECDVFALTPICSHSLTQRPLILPIGNELNFKSSDDDVFVFIDGQENFKLNKFDKISISLSDHKIKLIKQNSYDYFEILREKLKWGHNC